MIFFHPRGQKAVAADDVTHCARLLESAVWVDLIEPSREEEVAIEQALGFEVPTREEMHALELSQRLYREGDRLTMTATVVTRADSPAPASSPITFILSPKHLVTVRYVTSHPFDTFSERWGGGGASSSGEAPVAAMVGRIDALVERLADILEATSLRFDGISAEVFRPSAGTPVRRDYQQVLEQLGRASDLVSRAKESLTSLGRLVAFLSEALNQRPGHEAVVAHLKTISGDITALGEHVSFLIGKATFLLDASLGLISNEQNAIIKFVSVLALVFGPPTLVASIYGMNFQHMPELSWQYGYPLAVGVMVLSAVTPYLFFKHRRWL